MGVQGEHQHLLLITVSAANSLQKSFVRQMVFFSLGCQSQGLVCIGTQLLVCWALKSFRTSTDQRCRLHSGPHGSALPSATSLRAVCTHHVQSEICTHAHTHTRICSRSVVTPQNHKHCLTPLCTDWMLLHVVNCSVLTVHMTLFCSYENTML